MENTMTRIARVLFCTSLIITANATAQGATLDSLVQATARTAPGSQPAPTSTAEWADRCTDSRSIGWGFKDPKNFVRLLEQFSDPSIYLEFARRMEDPQAYARVASLMLEPGTPRNFAEWVDPVIYTKWLQAMADPNFYTAVLKPLSDPATLMRWLALPIDQRAWSVGLNTMNPAVWMNWMMAPLNPNVLEPLVKAADPNTTIKWLMAAADPSNYLPWSALALPQNGTPLVNGQVNNPANVLTPWGQPPAPGDARRP
jgi:hypothetical protein